MLLNKKNEQNEQLEKLQKKMNELMIENADQQSGGRGRGRGRGGGRGGGRRPQREEEREALVAQIGQLVALLESTNAELECVNALFDLGRRVLHTPTRLVPLETLVAHACLSERHAQQLVQIFQQLQAVRTLHFHVLFDTLYI